MDWRYIITIFFTIGLGITAIVLTIKLARRKKPVWAYTTMKIIGLGTNAPPELELTFNKRPLTDVYRTTFILFNRGNEAIRKEDITRNVTVHFSGAEILREPTVTAKSTEEIQFSARQVVKDGDNAIELDFLYLDHNDGAVTEVIHTTSEQIYCRANIIGAKEIANIGEFVLFPNRHRRHWWAGFITCLLAPFLAIFVIVLLRGFGYPSMEDILTYVIIVLGCYVGFFAARPRKAYILKKFPDWSLYQK